MERLALQLTLSPALAEDLRANAKLASMPVEAFAAEVIEAELAARRLPYVNEAAHGARIPIEMDKFL